MAANALSVLVPLRGVRHEILPCRKAGRRVKASTGLVHILQQFDGGLGTRFGMDAIDAFHRDRQQAVFERSYPALFLQISEMKLQMLARATQQLFKLDIADAGIVHVPPAFGVENRQQPVLKIDVPFAAFAVTGFLDQFPVGNPMVFMLNIVLHAF